MSAKAKDENLLARTFYVLGTTLMVLALLYYGKPVLIPVALSVLLAFILNPLVELLERWRLGRLWSVLLATAFSLMVLGVVAWGLAGQLRSLAQELPNHTREIKSKVEAIQVTENSTLGRLRKMFREVFPSDDGVDAADADTSEVDGERVPGGRSPVSTSPLWGPLAQFLDDEPGDKKADQDGDAANRPIVVAAPPKSPVERATDALIALVEPLATSALVIVLVLFLLLRREDVRYRFVSLMGDSALTGTTRLMQDTTERVSRYLANLTLVNALFGLWFAAGLYIIGVPYAPLWGFLTLFSRFIPFLGSPASVLFPMLISIATSSGWMQPLMVLVFFSVSELVTANVIEPVVFGKTTGLTPIALLLAALFWAWIWGPIGLLLSTPLTVCLVVMGQRIPALRSLKVLLAEQPALEPKLQFVQRLLARDELGAQDLFESYLKQFGLARAYDDLVVPALRWIRREKAKGYVSAEEAVAMRELCAQVISLAKEHYREVIDADQSEGAQSAAGESKSTAALASQASAEELPLIYGYPVHDREEEVVLVMLRELMHDQARFTLCTTKKLPNKAVSEIVETRPAAVVLSAVPPGGRAQLEYMCKRINEASPDTPIVVLFSGPISDYDDFLVQLRSIGATYLTTTLQQTRDQLLSSVIDVDDEAQSTRNRVIVHRGRLSDDQIGPDAENGDTNASCPPGTNAETTADPPHDRMPPPRSASAVTARKVDSCDEVRHGS